MKAKLWVKRNDTEHKLIQVDIPLFTERLVCIEFDALPEELTCRMVNDEFVSGEFGVMLMAEVLGDNSGWEKIGKLDKPKTYGVIFELIRDDGTVSKYLDEEEPTVTSAKYLNEEEDSPNKSLTDHLKSWF